MWNLTGLIKNRKGNDPQFFLLADISTQKDQYPSSKRPHHTRNMNLISRLFGSQKSLKIKRPMGALCPI